MPIRPAQNEPAKPSTVSAPLAERLAHKPLSKNVEDFRHKTIEMAANDALAALRKAQASRAPPETIQTLERASETAQGMLEAQQSAGLMARVAENMATVRDLMMRTKLLGPGLDRAGTLKRALKTASAPLAPNSKTDLKNELARIGREFNAAMKSVRESSHLTAASKDEVLGELKEHWGAARLLLMAQGGDSIGYAAEFGRLLDAMAALPPKTAEERIANGKFLERYASFAAFNGDARAASKAAHLFAKQASLHLPSQTLEVARAKLAALKTASADALGKAAPTGARGGLSSIVASFDAMVAKADLASIGEIEAFMVEAAASQTATAKASGTLIAAFEAIAHPGKTNHERAGQLLNRVPASGNAPAIFFRACAAAS